MMLLNASVISVTVSVLLAVISIVVPILSAQIPPGTKGCNRDDPKLIECAVKTANAIIPGIIQGYNEYDIPVMDPLEVKSITVTEKRHQGVDLDLTLENVDLIGLTYMQLDDDSKLNLGQRTMEIIINTPTLTLEGQYSMNGKILLLPINGAGYFNFTFRDLKMVYNTEFILQTANDGIEYLQMVNPQLDFTTSHFYIYLDNLFNGDEKIGNQMNVFLNEHWPEILTELKPAIRDVMKSIIFTVWNKAALKAPYDVLFPK